jgi:hypothetical protein
LEFEKKRLEDYVNETASLKILIAEEEERIRVARRRAERAGAKADQFEALALQVRPELEQRESDDEYDSDRANFVRYFQHEGQFGPMDESDQYEDRPPSVEEIGSLEGSAQAGPSQGQSSSSGSSVRKTFCFQIHVVILSSFVL